MSTDRRFCRFSRHLDRHDLGVEADVDDGFCLSAFVLLSRPGQPESVLAGHLDPEGPWDHVGGLNADRVRAFTEGWLLPASQLLLGESPRAAARRILDEMLGGIDPTLSEPVVVSEVYAPRRHPGHAHHWDLEFLFRGEWPSEPPRVPGLWRELRFVDTRRTPRTEFARSHDDVLASAGVPPRDV